MTKLIKAVYNTSKTVKKCKKVNIIIFLVGSINKDVTTANYNKKITNS